MRKINEIFYSLQGEGFHTGTPAVFVRFSGCNLKCPFCDTRHEEGTQMTDEAILAEVQKYPARMVILTGGEPSLWIDGTLVDLLHRAGKYISPKEGGVLKLVRMDEVKVVYEGQDLTPYEQLPAAHFFLQPCSCQNTAETVACVLAHPRWRLSLQTHKLIDIQ